MQARLYTRAGHYVATVEDVPAFHFPPEVMMWGTRLFVHQPDGSYVEALGWGVTRITFEASVRRRETPSDEEKSRE